MYHFTADSIAQLDKIFRVNLINSCTGYKSANLIATKSASGISNVAVFSSVTHLGSNPPLIGFILRPLVVERQTYKNIRETGVFTINHIHHHLIEKAHMSSAKYPADVSEFEITGLQESYLEGFYVPFVAESEVKIGLKFIEEQKIHANQTLLVVGEIEHLIIGKNLLQKDGFIELENAKTTAISGIDTYCSVQKMKRFEYARPSEPLKSIY
jgi:flavin reductase (DIM6/NTAB) family NADH-FMN oxidoreductase RutF